MDDQLAQQINSASSVLLVIPTDIEFSTIFAGVAMGQAMKGKTVTILNDAVTTNKLLIYKLKNFRFNALHTRAIRSFTLVINKAANKIKKSFIDETDEKISLSLETESGEYDPTSLIELKQPKIDQDLVIVLGSKEDKFPTKYAVVINKQAPEKTVFLKGSKTWAELVIRAFDRANFDEFSLTLLLASFITESRFLRTNINPETLDLMKQFISYGANYNDAFNVATAYTTGDESGFLVQEMANSKNMGGGIYYSHVEDPENIYSIKPPYMPLMVHFADCKICFTIISKPKYNAVFVVNNKERFNLDLIRRQYGGQGDNTYLYFKSEVDSKELSQDLIRKIIAITSGGNSVSQIISSPVLDEGTSQQPSKFTQGLAAGDPLSPAAEPIVPETTGTVNVPQNGDVVKIAEEC